MSRGNYILAITVFMAVMFSIIACSSPEKDGIKVGKKMCECEKIEPKYHITGADTRYPVKKIDEHYSKCIEEWKKYSEKVGEKYATNEKKLSKFKHAVTTTVSSCK
jgi:hypothetical protein